MPGKCRHDELADSQVCIVVEILGRKSAVTRTYWTELSYRYLTRREAGSGNILMCHLVILMKVDVLMTDKRLHSVYD